MSKSIQRVQTGVRIERRLLKVLKALAEQLDISLGDLLEGMALHCFEGKAPFSNETLIKIQKLKEVYELDLTSEDSHKLADGGNGEWSGDRSSLGGRACRRFCDRKNTTALKISQHQTR